MERAAAPTETSPSATPMIAIPPPSVEKAASPTAIDLLCTPTAEPTEQFGSDDNNVTAQIQIQAAPIVVAAASEASAWGDLSSDDSITSSSPIRGANLGDACRLHYVNP
jgi:hypothetical protein